MLSKYNTFVLNTIRSELDWERDDLNTETFFMAYDHIDRVRYLIAMIYFAFTTLSTVGFGDMHPKSDFERAFNIIIFVSGVSIFSYFMGNLIEILQNIMIIQAINEKDNELSMFLTALKKFNNS